MKIRETGARRFRIDIHFFDNEKRKRVIEFRIYIYIEAS